MQQLLTTIDNVDNREREFKRIYVQIERRRFSDRNNIRARAFILLVSITIYNLKL